MSSSLRMKLTADFQKASGTAMLRADIMIDDFGDQAALARSMSRFRLPAVKQSLTTVPDLPNSRVAKSQFPLQ